MKKMLHKGFNPSKCKTSLKMASSRVKLLRNKKGIQLTQLKREVAQLLQTGQDQTARIRVEHVVREEKTIAAYELIDLYCELIVARLPIIETQKHCPIDLKEAIASLIFASPRCSDIPELMDIRKHFTAKYGKEFVTAAVELRPDSGVTRSLIEKLSAVAPDGPTKVKILTAIAEENNIKWEPDWFKDNVPEPPAYVPNAPNTDKMTQMNVEPQIVQANPSNIHHVAEPENSKFVHSFAGTSGTANETVKPDQYFSSEENSSFGAGQKWNMEFKDASAAAQAAAESAEMASMAARAAAEIANRERPNSSRTQHLLADPKRNVKPAEYGRPNSFQQSDSPIKAVQEDRFQPNTGKRSSNEFIPYADHKASPIKAEYDRPNSFQKSNSPIKAVQEDRFHKESLLYEEQYEEEVKVHHDSSPEDSEFRRSDVDDPVENPLYGETWETVNQPKSYLSQPSGPSSDPPKFDDDLYEDPFDTNRGDIFYKEDLEREELYEAQKFDVHEQRNYSSDSHKHLFSEGGDYSIHEEKGSTTIDDAPHFDAPHFDDDGADEDEYIQSPGRKSPEYSSPDEERSPKKLGILSSRHLYQPELSESFKNSPIYSQLVKPISLGDDSDEAATSESDEERNSAEVVRSPFGRRVTSSIVSEDSTVEHHSDEISGSVTRSRSDAKSYDRSSFSRLLKEAERLSSSQRSSLQAIPDSDDDFDEKYNSSVESKIDLNVESLSGGLKNKGLRLPPYTKNTSSYYSSSSMLNVDDAPKVTSDDEIKEILGKRESIRKKKNMSLQGTTDFDPKYTRGTSPYSSSSSVSTVDDAPKVNSDDEVKDILGKREIIRKKKNSSLQGTDFDPKSDDADGKNSVSNLRLPPYMRGTSSYSSSSSTLTVDDAPKVTSDDEIKEILGKRESIRKKKTLVDADVKDSVGILNLSEKKFADNLDERSSSKVSRIYNDSEDASSAVPSRYQPSAGVSRRTRASGQSRGQNNETRSSFKTYSDTASGTGNDTFEEISSSSVAVKRPTSSQTETRSSYKLSSAEEEISSPSVAVKRPTSSQTETRSSYKISSGTESGTGSDASSAKPKTRTGPSHLSKMSAGEEISSPSVSVRRAASSQSEKTRSSYKTPSSSTSNAAETQTSAKPKPKSMIQMESLESSSQDTQKTLSRENSDKKASHVHPKLPDWDDFASHFRKQ